MTNRVKLLASDLDGTFLTSTGEISAENQQALAKARAAGLEVVFVTGRPARWLRVIAEAVNYQGLMIGANGGFVADLSTNQVIERVAVDNQTAEIAINRVLEVHPDLSVGVERSYVGMPLANATGLAYQELKVTSLSEFEFAVTANYPGPKWRHSSVPVAELDVLIRQPDITKIIIKPGQPKLGQPESWNSDSWLAEVKPLIGDLLQVTHASQDAALVELSAPGVTKAAAIERLATSRGITASEVAAVGDMPNDTDLLDWAGHAWTVANAHPELLDRFPNRLPSNDQHAVAALINQLLA